MRIRPLSSGDTVETAEIANDAVTYAKIQNVSATDMLLGRSTSGAGDVEEIACTAAGRALLDDAAASNQRTTLGLGTLAVENVAAVPTLTLADAANLVLNATTGTKIGTATTQKLGFYNATPIVQAGAYTQTYATADKTMANLTSADLGAFTGGVVGFLDAAERDNIRTQFNALRADLADVKQAVNSLIDDLQALGFVG